MHLTASTLCKVRIHSWSQNAGNGILEAHILKLCAGEHATGSLYGLAPSALVGAGIPCQKPPFVSRQGWNLPCVTDHWMIDQCNLPKILLIQVKS